ncbi:amidase [Variovorax sp. J31P207]|uniref:amidase n=1 Tax=Variovorax sp. J31P207 TaxID=3053510 RepID=UPI0025775042|nr:amidase [Variovorax sp. J31P207]MDM0065230.1 amidase [Variovorax sp. J31P207]
MEQISKLETVETMLSRIEDPRGQGSVVFTQVYREQARASAASADVLEKAGIEQHPLAGVAVSVKDLFDVKGAQTLAGSRALSNAKPASQDATVVARLRRCGAAIIGKTNMTEFAFSGLGINPHYGTPVSVWDRPARRIPGGSSSGAAVSVAEGMAWAAIGTDTGGSCRIPAAFNGIVGMKPTASTVPRDGALPLSSSYDSVGPLASTVADCARVYSVISGSTATLVKRECSTLRLGVIRNYVLEGLDDYVGHAYEAALKKLAEAGAVLHELTLPVLNGMPDVLHGGGLVAAEAFQWHRELLASNENEYDPRVSLRILRGQSIGAADYISLLAVRERMIQRWSEQIAEFDAVLMPTVPTVAPQLESLEDDDEYGRVNLLLLRNPTVVNIMDGCAVSVPCHERGGAPVGLSIAGDRGRDWLVLSIARIIEQVLAG